MFTKNATLALSAISTQAIKIGTVAQVDAEADAEFGSGGVNPFANWCKHNSVHPICGGLAQTEAESQWEWQTEWDKMSDWMAQTNAEAEAEKFNSNQGGLLFCMNNPTHSKCGIYC